MTVNLYVPAGTESDFKRVLLPRFVSMVKLSALVLPHERATLSQSGTGLEREKSLG